MSDAVCVVVCVCVSFAREVGEWFVLRCLHEHFLLLLFLLLLIVSITFNLVNSFSAKGVGSRTSYVYSRFFNHNIESNQTIF